MTKLNHPSVTSRAEAVETIFTTLGELADEKNPEELPQLKYLNELILGFASEYDKETEQDKADKFKGDLFEVFAELYFKFVRSKNNAGVIDYEPLYSGTTDINGNEVDDYGVDGVGKNYADELCAVQVKFRANPLEEISYNELSNTDTQARRAFGVETLNDNTIILFTNCSGANERALSQLKNSLYIVNIDAIKSEVDGNIVFWKWCRDTVVSNVNQ